MGSFTTEWMLYSIGYRSKLMTKNVAKMMNKFGSITTHEKMLKHDFSRFYKGFLINAATMWSNFRLSNLVECYFINGVEMKVFLLYHSVFLREMNQQDKSWEKSRQK